MTAAGYFSEAEAIYREILSIDPLSSNALWRLGNTAAMQGRLDEAISMWKKAADPDADDDFAHYFLAMAYLIANDDENAARHLASTWLNADWLSYPDEQTFIRAARDPVSGKATLDKLVATKEAATRIMFDARPAYDLYLAFGYLDEYMTIIDRLVRPTGVWSDSEDMETFGMTYPQTGFVAHPSFIRRAKASGMTDLWEKRGEPDHCSKDTGDWVCQ